MKSEVKALQEPDNYRRYEDDRECSLQEVLRLVPQESHYVLGTRQTVIRQLHDERDGLAPEQRAAIEKRYQYGDQYPEDIEACHDKTAASREECVDEERINRDFG